MTSTDHIGNPLKGIALVVLAVLAFACSDVVTKYLAERHPVSVVVAVRYTVNLLLLLVFLGPRMGATLWTTQRTGLVIVRALVLAAGSLTMGLALRVMPVAETVSIVYISPFLVMLLADPILGEKVTLPQWIGAAVGFAGVLLILRPGTGLDSWGVTLALLNALCATGYAMMTRALSKTETTLAMLFMVAVVGTVFFWLLAIPDLNGLNLGARDFALAALLGGLATLGHFLFTAAYREAPASLLGPVNYIHLVWAAVLGWFVFGHIPQALTVLGMVMVAGAGAVTALRAHLVRRAAKSVAEAA